MELKATSLGRHLAQHPYNRVRLLHAGVEVCGEKHEYLIPFNQLLAIHCRRGLVWGELEFTLPDEKVVRLHGTEWRETCHFYHHLMAKWQAWSLEMSYISAQVLKEALKKWQSVESKDDWLTHADLADLQSAMQEALDAQPLPVARLDEFQSCREPYHTCLAWLQQGDTRREQRNVRWIMEIRAKQADFFQMMETSPLNEHQAGAVVNGESSVRVMAGAGCGKTSVLIARAGWLLLRGAARAEQILLLAPGQPAVDALNDRLRDKLNTHALQAITFDLLAGHIIQHGGQRPPVVSKLETDDARRYQQLITVWRQQCDEKKTQAKGWRQCLGEEFGWELSEALFWHDDHLAQQLVPHLDRWLNLMRTMGGTQSALIEFAPDEWRDPFAKRVRLMAPLLKAWKKMLKEEEAVDSNGLIQQAIAVLKKKRFVSPWKHILVDGLQDLMPQQAALLSALREQNSWTSLFATGDDAQSVYRFHRADRALITEFNHYFTEGDTCILDTSYRFNDRIGDIANRLIQTDPAQPVTSLKSVSRGNKKSISLLPAHHLDALLDKISGYAKPGERILLLARYHSLRPALLTKAKTRWPGLNPEFLTIHASKGQQADYVIVLGSQQGDDGFPATQQSVTETVLLSPEEASAELVERRLAYVAITRAKNQAWLLFNQQNPSDFVSVFKKLGVPVLRKP